VLLLHHFLTSKSIIFLCSQTVCSTQDCFRAAWSSHKSVHPKPGAPASQQSPEGWKYCLRKGRERALQLPRFDWTG
jgi:hypothetical protein